MRIVVYASSLLSAYWNGAATYYRGIFRALAALGHEIVFCEPDAFGRQENRDMAPPEWARVVVWPATGAGLAAVLHEAERADVVVKASGVGVFDDALAAAVPGRARPGALRIYWDVDAPATLATLAVEPDHPLRLALPAYDHVFTYGGGRTVVEAFRALGARDCEPIYNALDPDTHGPAAPDPRFAADLSLLANRLPDREARVRDYFLGAAERLPERRFLLAGSGWADADLPGNVAAIGHLGTTHHDVFNASALAVLNVTREDMARTGFSPATRVFEAAGAGACLVSDDWPGLDAFLAPGREVLPARDGRDVAAILSELAPETAAAIGAAARARVLADHTYDRRAEAVDRTLARLASMRAERAVTDKSQPALG